MGRLEPYRSRYPVRAKRPVIIRVLLFSLLLFVSAHAEPEVSTTILRPGKGTEIMMGQTAEVGYTLTLESGTLIDQATARSPFTFELGSDSVIPGFSMGVAGMKVGELRRVVIPPELGYGNQDNEAIPPQSTLNFDVELLAILEADDHDHEHDHANHQHSDSGDEVGQVGDDHDHGDEDADLSQKFLDEEYLKTRHAQKITRPAIFEYLIRQFHTQPWKYEDGYVNIGKSALKVATTLAILIGILWFGIRKRYLTP